MVVTDVFMVFDTWGIGRIHGPNFPFFGTTDGGERKKVIGVGQVLSRQRISRYNYE